MTRTIHMLTASRAPRSVRSALSLLFVGLLIVAQALAVAHRSDVARHTAAVTETAAIDRSAALPATDAAGDAGNHDGEQTARDSASCELCHVAGKLPAIATTLITAVGAAPPVDALLPAITGLAITAPRRRSALPRAPPRAIIEAR